MIIPSQSTHNGISTTPQPGSGPASSPAKHGKPVLKFRIDDDYERTAGSMPVWNNTPDAAEEIAATLSDTSEQADAQTLPSTEALAFTAQGTPANETGDEYDEGFGFGDLIDIINPLQHIPLVNKLYRELTGDEINPASRVVGGTLFGGPIGGAGALVNVIAEDATGTDIAGNVYALVSGDEENSSSTAIASAAPLPDHPEAQLDRVARHQERPGEDEILQKLPGTMLSFAELNGGKRRIVERFVEEDLERTAGTMIRSYMQEPMKTPPAREEITTLSFASRELL